MGVPGGSGGFRRVPGVKVPGEGVPWCSGMFRGGSGEPPVGSWFYRLTKFFETL